MKFVQLEGTHPLEKPKWEGQYLFPHTLFRVRPWRGGRTALVTAWGGRGAGCLSQQRWDGVLSPRPALGAV